MSKTTENIDWKLLRAQKESLLEILTGRKLTKRRKRDLQGILHLIDALQNGAADKRGE